MSKSTVLTCLKNPIGKTQVFKKVASNVEPAKSHLIKDCLQVTCSGNVWTSVTIKFDQSQKFALCITKAEVRFKTEFPQNK